MNLKEVASSKIDIENGLATIDDVDELVKLKQTNSRQSIAELLNKGDLCFYSRYNEKIISYCWYATKEGSALYTANFKVPEKTVYSYDSYTLPQYRRLSVNSALVFYAQSYFKKEGFRSMYYLVGVENIPNIALNEKLGAVNLGTLTANKILLHNSLIADSDVPENIVKIKKYFNIE